MKHVMFAVLCALFALTMVACQETTNNDYNTVNVDTCCSDTPTDNDAITVTLSPDSPSGEIPPGNRVLAVFTVNTNKATEIYGMDLDVVDNYDDPDYWMVDTVWIENLDGKIIYQPRYLPDGYIFWGTFQVPAGKSAFVVKGHVTMGEQFNEEWNPRPTVQVLVNSIYAGKEVNPEAGLTGNVLIPKYTGITTVQTSLANDSPSGTLYEGYSYMLYKFHMWSDQGDFIFSNAAFEVTAFDGDLPGCSFWEGNTLISDQSAVRDYGNMFVLFDENSESQQLLITTTPRTFSLHCQVETNSDHQPVQVRLIGGQFQTGPSGMYTHINVGPWSLGFDFIKQEVFQLSLHPDSVAPKQIVPGANQTLMKFYMTTSAGLAEVYTLGFTFRNWFSGDYSNCRLQDSQGTVINTSASAGFDPNGGSDLYMTFFFGPQDGIYPGYGSTYKVGTNLQEIYMVCDVGYQPGHAMAIDLNYASLYTESVHNYRVLPDGYIKITTTVFQ